MMLDTQSNSAECLLSLPQLSSRIQMSRTLSRSADVSLTVVQSQVRESRRVLGDLCM